MLFRAKNDTDKNETNKKEIQSLKKPPLRLGLKNNSNSNVLTCEPSLKVVVRRASDTKQVCAGKKNSQLEVKQSIKTTEDRAEKIRHQLIMATKKREVDSRRRQTTDKSHAPPHRENHAYSDAFKANRLSSLSMNDSSCEGRPRRESITISDLSSGKGPRARAGSMIDNEGSLTTDDLYGFLRAASSLDSSSTLESSTASKKSILKEGKYCAGHTSMPSLEHGRSSRRSQTNRKSFHHSLDDNHHWISQQRNQQVTFLGTTKVISISENQFSQPTHHLILNRKDCRDLQQSRDDSDRLRNERAQFYKSEGVARYPIHGHKSFDDLAVRRTKAPAPPRSFHNSDGVKPLSNDEIDRYNHQRDRKFDNGPFQLSKKEEEVIMRSMGVRVREAQLQHDDGDNIVYSKPSAFKKLLGIQPFKPEELSHNQARLVAANAAFASVEDRIL